MSENKFLAYFRQIRLDRKHLNLEVSFKVTNSNLFNTKRTRNGFFYQEANYVISLQSSLRQDPTCKGCYFCILIDKEINFNAFFILDSQYDTFPSLGGAAASTTG